MAESENRLLPLMHTSGQTHEKRERRRDDDSLSRRRESESAQHPILQPHTILAADSASSFPTSISPSFPPHDARHECMHSHTHSHMHADSRTRVSRVVHSCHKYKNPPLFQFHDEVVVVVVAIFFPVRNLMPSFASSM